jgi:valyl-tRNA synthetase
MLPYVTEEVWSWWHEGSVHRAAWPTTADAAAGADGDSALLTAVGEALAGVRKAKSEAKVGMRAEVASIVLAGSGEWADRVRLAEADLRAAGRITGTIDYAEAETPEVRDAELIPVEKPKA